MMRALPWLFALLSLAMIGTVLWPADHRSVAVLLGGAALVIAGLSSGSLVARGAATILTTVMLTSIALPELLIATGADPRIPWTALLVVSTYRPHVIRTHTLVAAAVVATFITPPSDISLLSAAPPVLLQTLICASAVALQLVDRDGKPWWPWYRALEPFVVTLIAAVALAPFARNGLTLAGLLTWHAVPATAATAAALVFALLEGSGARQSDALNS